MTGSRYPRHMPRVGDVGDGYRCILLLLGARVDALFVIAYYFYDLLFNV